MYKCIHTLTVHLQVNYLMAMVDQWESLSMHSLLELGNHQMKVLDHWKIGPTAWKTRDSLQLFIFQYCITSTLKGLPFSTTLEQQSRSAFICKTQFGGFMFSHKGISICRWVSNNWPQHSWDKFLKITMKWISNKSKHWKAHKILDKKWQRSYELRL